MKKINLFILSALSMMAVVGCSKESNNLGTEPESGVPTYVNFSIKLDVPSTYAAGGDNNADAVEQKIQNLKMYIFTGGVLETIGDITLDANNTGTSILKTSTGEKVIYAVANYNSDMTMAVGATFESFQQKAVAALAADIATSNDFVMVGNTEVTLVKQTENEAKANPIAIAVSRAAAKVVMQYTASVDVKIDGTISEQKFCLAQMNKQMFLPRTGYELTPGANNLVDANPADGTYDHLTSVLTNNSYINIPSSYNTSFATSAYTAENVNTTPTTGNTTFALVSLKYTPSANVINGVDKTLVNGTFYLVIKADQTAAIYANKTEADAAQGAITPGAEAKVYTGGICYYRINIRDTKGAPVNQKFCVLRNYCYKINITEINTIGGNTPTDPDVITPIDPETPVEIETSISATISIEPWTERELDEPLG